MTLIRSFEADGEDGNSYTLRVYQEERIIRNRSGEHRISGMQRILTDDGEPVEQAGEGRYVIMGRRGRVVARERVTGLESAPAETR